MIKVVWNIVKSLFGVIFSIFRPFRRLICRRRRLSESDGSELTSIGTGNMMIETPLPFGQEQDAPEIELEAWDNWEVQSSSYKLSQSTSQSSHLNGQHSTYVSGGDQPVNGYGTKPVQNFNYNQKQPEPEPDINFFEDMTPNVKKQTKILIRKKDAFQSVSLSPLSNRLAVMSDVPFSNSELEAWEDENNAWDSGEILEDLTWQAEEAIKEKKKKERMERQVEQQKKKQKKEELRNLKSGSLIATKLS